MKTKDQFQKIAEISREAATLSGVEQLLHWDQETHMPSDAAEARAQQCELIARLVHERQTGKRFEKALSELIDLGDGTITEKGLSLPQRAALREWREDFLRATKLPTRFVQETARLHSQAVEAWRSAREVSSFARYAPFLEKLFDNARKRADYLGYESSPYDALVDEFEPGMTRRKIATLFNDLKPELIALRAKLREKPDPNRDFLHKKYPASKQMDFARDLLEACGFTDERGSLALVSHPFCLAPHPTDGRVTTRIDERDPMNNFLAAIHEGGHYLYEVSLPVEHFGTPLCQPISLGMHESQSRWWEVFVGQSLPFWKYYFPRLKKLFPTQLKGVSLNTFYRGLNAILDTPIRILSDEISYPLHVILRFEIESQLVEGKLKIRDLPDAWNSHYEEYLGITPKNDAEGCLQDVHWAMGLIGYFPTYALGNIYAAQFFNTFTKKHRNWATQVAKGNFAPMRQWLNENIHRYGRTYTSAQIVKRVTGDPLSTDSYLTHLKKKYTEVYKL
jgi:carboxypeptidase Taq